MVAKFLLVVTLAVIAGIYRQEILQFAVENFDLCPQIDEKIAVVEAEEQKKEESEEEKPQIIEVDDPKTGAKIQIEKKKVSYSINNPSDKARYWLIDPNPDENLVTVKTVLDRLGLERYNGSLQSETAHDGWNLIWSTKTSLPLNWKEIKFHQKFNHFPWSKMLSSKSVFGTTTDSKFVPKAFTELEKLKIYAKENPEKKFLRKLKTKGGVRYQDLSKLESLTPDDDFFIQEAVQNPLLFDGHKFEFSIFVLISSVDPLRLYYFPKNMMIKFAPEKYDEDFDDSDRYVADGEDHITALDFEGTREYFFNGYTFREAFDGFLKKQNASVEEVWKNIEDCIRSIVVGKEKDFVAFFEKINEYKYPYFELFSFDFLLDASFKLHLININSNPDLSSANKYIRNRFTIENLLYNVFKLIGVGTPYIKKEFVFENVELEMMVAHAHSRTVLPEFCIYDCDKTCDGRCMICMRCMKQSQFYETIIAYQEQMNIGDFKRLFPPSKEFLEEVGVEKYFENFDNRELFQLDWFMEMCKKNRYFC
ncbi:hypothetical protein PVAND_017406 [Polypedilum vanderplanki]|uniref:Uncharacterized protein n=1 Tax=Polypedilum vanderplanki TaxID=319348 RepID=A0A9J6BIY3_POLVA|nr:hypothetical protein PVAND_017406 [Polypedilum vanderplanki]